MRKFAARWWVTPVFVQWRYLHETCQYPYHLWAFPHFGPMLEYLVK